MYIQMTQNLSCVSEFTSLGLQSDLDAVSAGVPNGNLNISKCACVHFKLNSPTVTDACSIINNKLISSQHTQRDLSILVSSDYKLTWHNYHKIVCAQAYRSLYLIKEQSTANPTTKKTLDFTLVRS
jgi:hypothetical protein